MERCTVRQLGAALFAALLAPASALPAILARGGALGWLAPLLVLPVAVFVVWRVGKLGVDGLAPALRGPLGKTVLTLYYIWALALSALTAGSCVDRLGRTDYLSAPPWLLAVALAAVCAYLIRKGPAPFFRAAQIFYLVLLTALVLLLVLGVANLKGANLAPQGWSDLSGAVEGIVPAGASLSVAALAAFFPRERRRKGESPLWHWLAGWCLAAAGLFLLTVGALGPRLTAKAPLPFFLALQGLGFSGGFQRLEALTTALWVLSDLTLLGLAALAGREMAGGRAWAAAPPLLAAFLGGWFLPNAAVVRAADLLFWVDLALGAAVPVLLSLLPAGNVENERGISCG